MGVGPFSTESKTSQKTNALNNQIGVSDQGVAVRNQKSGNWDIKLAKGATYVVNNGLNEDDFFKRLETIVGDRAEVQVDAGAKAAVVEAAGKLGVGNWILIALGSAAFLAVVFWKGRRG